VLHLIGDDEDPHGVVAKLMSAVPPGSYLALSHVASDIEPEKMAAMRERLNRLVAEKGTYRTRDEVTRFFDGLELVEPGMVRIQQWRPDSEIQARSAAAMWGGAEALAQRAGSASPRRASPVAGNPGESQFPGREAHGQLERAPGVHRGVRQGDLDREPVKQR
jgi:S-adenosyl methyltransferase